jgi:transposase-like protein
MKTYTEEFKKAAIARVAAGEMRKAVATDLKIAASLITSWRNKIEGTKKKKKKTKMRKYDAAVREKALKLLDDGTTQSDAARRLGVTAAIVHYWSGARNKQRKKEADVPGKKKANGTTHETDKRDVRDAMVFFNKALKLAKQKGMDPLKDSVILNVAYGVSLLETKV